MKYLLLLLLKLVPTTLHLGQGQFFSKKVLFIKKHDLTRVTLKQRSASFLEGRFLALGPMSYLIDWISKHFPRFFSFLQGIMQEPPSLASRPLDIEDRPLVVTIFNEYMRPTWSSYRLKSHWLFLKKKKFGLGLKCKLALSVHHLNFSIRVKG